MVRREWSGLIRERQWHEFEKIAKAEPSQTLANTISELELGFEDKSDRRALRKILFLLKQAGIQPDVVEETGDPVVVAGPLGCTIGTGPAIQMSPGIEGSIRLMIPFEIRGRIQWWSSRIHGVHGVETASQEEETLERAEQRRAELLGYGDVYLLTAEVPREYAMGRLKHALDGSKLSDPTTASWRAKLRDVAPISGPSLDGIPALPYSDELVSQEREAQSALYLWRLELGKAADVYENLVNRQGADSYDIELLERAVDATLATLFDAPSVEDHVFRLREMAYLSNLRGVGEPSAYLAVANHLEVEGARAPYAKALLMRAVLEFAANMEAKANETA